MLQVVLRLPLRLWCRRGGEAWLPWAEPNLARWRRKGGKAAMPREAHQQSTRSTPPAGLEGGEGEEGGRSWPTRHRLQEATLAPLGMRRPHGVMTRQSLEDGRLSLHYLVDIAYLILS
jgi:hypothetical protein